MIYTYKIYSIENPDDYIIETTKQSMNQRMNMYKRKYFKHLIFGSQSGITKKILVNIQLFYKYGFDNCDIELII